VIKSLLTPTLAISLFAVTSISVTTAKAQSNPKQTTQSASAKAPKSQNGKKQTRKKRQATKKAPAINRNAELDNPSELSPMAPVDTQAAKTPDTPPVSPVSASGESESVGGTDVIETVGRRSGVSLTSKNAIRLNYGRNDWNQSSTKVDTAAVFLREGTSGRIVQIEVEESAPDSAVFSGTYSINFRDLTGLKVEFFAPPQNLLSDLTGRKKISQMIDAKELRRLPFVLRKDPVTGVQNVELFDNADQARNAYRAFQAEQELLVALKNRLDQRNQTLDTAMLALEKAEFEEISRNLAERVRLSQVETQRLAALLQSFSLASPEDRAKRKADAQKLADQAMVEYRANQFPQAKKSFEAAVDLDPSNRGYYFQYGVTLYKIEDFNRSLVYLDLAESKAVKAAERDFYRGLNFYRLRDSNSALTAFEKVVNAKDPEISPSARFYQGLIHFEKRRWTEARAEFQLVLDESNDPVLDQRAEGYIEQALRMQQIEAERAKRWALAGTFGAMYDDNVLLSSDSDRDRGTATNAAAWRTLLQGTAKYRAVYEDTNEWAIQLDAMTMYSVDKDFQTVQSISNSDATIAGLTAPWTHKGVFMGKGHKFDLVPGVETTYMSVENNEWKSIYNSYILNFQNLFVVSETWFTNVNVDLRQDVSGLASSTGDDDSTAFKSKISWSNINIPFEDKKQLVLSDFGYTVNSSLGKNSVFNRLDIGVGYIRPWKWDTTFNSKLSYYLLTYPENATGRIDNNIGLTLGLSRKVGENLTSGFTTNYQINSSNVTANQYKKLTAMVTLTATEAF
jgi:tetratricopeptide (TPR) repeat protein